MIFLLKHPSIKGEYNIQNYSNCVKIHNVSFLIHRHIDQKTGSPGRNVGIAKHEGVSFLRKMDASTTSFKNEMFLGSCNDCEIIFLDNTNKYVLSLKNAILSQYYMEANVDADQVIEHIKFSCTDMDFRKAS